MALSSVDIHPLLKGTLVFVLLAILAVLAVSSIVLGLAAVASDGHSRIEDRRLVRIF